MLEEGYFNIYEFGKCFFYIIILVFIIKDGEFYVSFGLMGGVM